MGGQYSQNDLVQQLNTELIYWPLFCKLFRVCNSNNFIIQNLTLSCSFYLF